MSTIISILVKYNQLLLSQISQLLIFIAKNIPLSKPKYDITSPKYNKHTVDKVPIIKIFKRLDYKQLLTEYKITHGKDKRPVNPRGKNPVLPDTICPQCGAPHIYIYDNTGGRGQLWCKVCDLRFNKNKVDFKTETFICPFCGHVLSKKKDRKNFYIHKCVNKKCSYYMDSLAKLSLEDIKEYKKDKHKFKLHYIYREFTTNYFDVDLSSMPKGATSLKFRNFSSHVMGLCLTYNVNLGLSTRRTALALWEIHGVRISHVTVSKYAISAAAFVKPYVDNYDYKPTNYLAADETYTKVKGVHQYIWLVMDAIKKSILGYQASFSRDTGPCILTMRMAFDKYKEFPGKSLKFVADGYTAYKLAEQQFKLNNMDFDVTQVIGLTNSDPISTEYRWLKQIIERLNRTFKFSYRVTNGFGSEEGSNTHLALFVAYYNFLRPHSYSYWGPLNSIPELEKIPTMPGKWQKLIELSQQLIIEKQVI
ncbi:DDE-type integrase/transposase/recombinase [Clostridium bowmanii]|uniref:DDE-type integrase/transposase/recombinase n=2 Tax=Clostridium bowmanii TaxID=132925 RepID=UPI001CD4E0E9|nr:DDE-type integrase/transposase/recombinase [Clostridium bowmanii]MCA1076544.1 DDE-type integrase/transposase/recombinase [Clostridium bowmanii]